MKLLNMHGRPLCLLYSAAMVLDADVEDMIAHIGWSGLERIWPDFPEPYCYRSHHMQEIQEYAITWHRKCFYPIEHEPRMSSHPQAKPILVVKQGDDTTARFMSFILGKRGIMIGESKKGKPHAWAWNKQECYDPNGFITDISDYRIVHECWVLGHI